MNKAVPDIAFGTALKSDWYNAAAMGYVLFMGFASVMRNLLTGIFSGFFPNIPEFSGFGKKWR